MRTAAFAFIVVILPQLAAAQQPSAPAQQQAPAQQPQPSAPQFQQSPEWTNLPKMVLERQFSGPLQDTVIQRLRDPVDGTVCYLYLPISAPHSPTTSTGFVQYGPNGIGSVSCMPGRPGPVPTPAPASQGQRK
jgi:hypothetical protein